MSKKTGIGVIPYFLLAVGLAGCDAVPASNNAQTAPSTEPAPPEWPASLRIVGDGYPNPGDPCRRIGETEATVNFLDDSAALVGCRTGAQAAALGGQTVATVDGITLVSVPEDRTGQSGEGDSQSDAKVAGTNYNATAEVPCKGPGTANGACKAGVTRGPDQIAVDITLPGGKTRTLLFDGKGKFITHRSAQADGSAALASAGKREGDWTVISVGPEQYRVPDAFTLGD